LHHLVVYARSAPKVADLVRLQGYTGTITACSTPDEARLALPSADILLVARMPAELYPLLTQCKWIQSLNAGIDDLVSAPVPAGVPTTRIVDLFGGYISEFILGYIFAHTLRMRENHELQSRAEWKHYYINRLEGKTLGLAGLGSIGVEVARRAAALGLNLKGLSRSGSPIAGVTDTYTPDQILSFCTGVDFLALTLPFTPETDGLFGAEALTALNPGAVVINCGRGRVLQEEATIQALRSGQLSGAVLDVFNTEPLPADHLFWTEPGLIVTPHVSGPSVPDDIARYFMANYERFLSGQPLQGMIDRDRGY
jgi:glyoxylate/hydroxypyruvate reductase